MEKQKVEVKEDWMTSPASIVKLKELVSLLGVELLNLSPSDNGQGHFIGLRGQEHLLEGLKLILKVGNGQSVGHLKEEWIFGQGLSHPSNMAKFDELRAILDVGLIQILPTENGQDRQLIKLRGPGHIIEALAIMLKPGITF